MSEQKLTKSLRTREGQTAYDQFKKDNVDKPAFHDWPETLIKEWKHWRLIKNSFPGTRVFEVHHLLIPKRVFGNFYEMNEEERVEMWDIKKELSSQYDACLENLNDTVRSIPEHYHIHFVNLYRHNWEWENNQNS